MTTAEKARAYDKALETAKSLLGTNQIGDAWIKRILPEAEGSEDERMYKAILIYLDWMDGRNEDYQPKGDYTIKDMLSWFKKWWLKVSGKEQESDNVVWPNISNCIRDCKKCAAKCFYRKEPSEYIPKFKAGDWLVTCKQGVSRFIHIIAQEGETYKIEMQGGEFGSPSCKYVDENYRIFSIEAARDGDVITWNDGKCIAIFFKTSTYKDSFFSHGFLETLSGEFDGNGHYHEIKGDVVRPATREEIDVLTGAMEKAGYVWDYVTKELKNIH